MTLKHFVQDRLNEGKYVALISFDVKDSFDAAWWPSISNSMKTKNAQEIYTSACATSTRGALFYY